MFRGDPKSFATDGKALEVTRKVLERGFDVIPQMLDLNQQYFYMPLMHSEAVADQCSCVELIDTRMDNEQVLKFAREHLLVIERFGRFPHRNLILARTSTADELVYLAEDGSEF